MNAAKMQYVVIASIVALLAVAVTGPVWAQAAPQLPADYTVQAGDWLAAVAAMQYGDADLYPAIVLATVEKAGSDSSYADVVDPWRIEVGWKLHVPDGDTARSGLTVTALENATYQSEWTQTKTAPLTDGKYTEVIAPGSASKIEIGLSDRMAFGFDAEGTPFAAVILYTNSGGSGTFIDLGVVVQEDGTPVNTALTSLGDRVQVQSLGVDGGKVVVEMTTHGPDDPMCCPTQGVRKVYAVQGESFIEESSEGGTQVIAFDPTSIPINPDLAIRTATCEASAVVPRPGAFQCTFEGGGQGDPCFVVEGNTLMCGPDPVYGSYVAVVTASEPLPEAGGLAGDPIPFYLDLGSSKPPCELRAEPLEVSGQMVTYTCRAPGAFLVGELDTSRTTWVAQYITTDTQASQITYGPEPSGVVRAWVH
jgi:hypothetical protein